MDRKNRDWPWYLLQRSAEIRRALVYPKVGSMVASAVRRWTETRAAIVVAEERGPTEE